MSLCRADHVDAAAGQVATDTNTEALAVDHGVVLGLDDGQDPLPGAAGPEGSHVRAEQLDLVQGPHVQVHPAVFDAVAQEAVTPTANADLHLILPGNPDHPGHVVSGVGDDHQVRVAMPTQAVVNSTSHLIVIGTLGVHPATDLGPAQVWFGQKLSSFISGQMEEMKEDHTLFASLA